MPTVSVKDRLKVVATAFVVVGAFSAVYAFVPLVPAPGWLTLILMVSVIAASSFLVSSFIQTPPGTPNRWGLTIAAGFAVVVLAGAVGFGVYVLTVNSITPEPEPPVSVAIDVPKDPIQQFNTVRGTASGLPEGSTIWVLVSLPDDSQHYLQDRPCVVQGGEVTCSDVTIGTATDAKTVFNVRMCVADSSDTMRFMRIWQDVSGRPESDPAKYASRTFNALPGCITVTDPAKFERSA